ncbi:hypothetical protein EJ06DRAFT_259085 [Trichodelitschia bisporula]|uniref:Uncharacterized protein n=1 Tax=Trichodelitschia bisporula TaxID=703511 RepID=A0A6G1HJB7_9PEZI|nr:hypothetical protein EJ06DRAFT_259085 [Trichodelitschia bisporula]
MRDPHNDERYTEMEILRATCELHLDLRHRVYTIGGHACLMADDWISPFPTDYPPITINGRTLTDENPLCIQGVLFKTLHLVLADQFLNFCPAYYWEDSDSLDVRMGLKLRCATLHGPETPKFRADLQAVTFLACKLSERGATVRPLAAGLVPVSPFQMLVVRQHLAVYRCLEIFDKVGGRQFEIEWVPGSEQARLYEEFLNYLQPEVRPQFASVRAPGQGSEDIKADSQ